MLEVQTFLYKRSIDNALDTNGLHWMLIWGGRGGWKQLIEKCVPDIISLCKFSDARLTSNYISVWLRWFWGELTRFSDLLVQLWGASHPINQAEHCKHHPFSSYNHRLKKHTHHQVYPSPVLVLEWGSWSAHLDE